MALVRLCRNCRQVIRVRGTPVPTECDACGAQLVEYGGSRPFAGQVHAFRPYEALSCAPLPSEWDRAVKIGRDHFVREKGGQLRQINPPGFELDSRSGAPVIHSRDQKRRLLKTAGLTDYSA
jgi:hypothetical protein